MKYTTENIEKYNLKYYKKHNWEGWRSHRDNGEIKGKFLLVESCSVCGEKFFTPYKNPGNFCSVACRNKVHKRGKST